MSQNLGFPFLTVKPGHPTYASILIRSYTELLILLFAHEGRHMWQYSLCPTEGQFMKADESIPSPVRLRSERDADWYATGKLKKWRALQEREEQAYFAAR